MTILNQFNEAIIPAFEAVCDCPVIRGRLKGIAMAMLAWDVLMLLLLIWLPREEWPEFGKWMASGLVAFNAGAFLAILIVRN